VRDLHYYQWIKRALIPRLTSSLSYKTLKMELEHPEVIPQPPDLNVKADAGISKKTGWGVIAELLDRLNVLARLILGFAAGKAEPGSARQRNVLMMSSIQIRCPILIWNMGTLHRRISEVYSYLNGSFRSGTIGVIRALIPPSKAILLQCAESIKNIRLVVFTQKWKLNFREISSPYDSFH